MTGICFHCTCRKLEKKNEINYKLINNIYINTYSSLLYIILLNNYVFIYNYNTGQFIRSIYDSEFMQITNFSYDQCYLKLGVNITHLNILNRVKIKDVSRHEIYDIIDEEYNIHDDEDDNYYDYNYDGKLSQSNYKYNHVDDIDNNNLKDPQNDYIFNKNKGSNVNYLPPPLSPSYMSSSYMSSSYMSSSYMSSSSSYSSSFSSTYSPSICSPAILNSSTENVGKMKVSFDLLYKDNINEEKNLKSKKEVGLKRENNMYRHNFENNCIYKYIVKTQIPIISFVLFRDSNLSKKCLPLTKLLYHFFMPKNCIQVCKELYPFLINFPSIPFSLCIHGKESTFSFVIPMSTQIYYFF